MSNVLYTLKIYGEREHKLFYTYTYIHFEVSLGANMKVKK